MRQKVHKVRIDGDIVEEEVHHDLTRVWDSHQTQVEVRQVRASHRAQDNLGLEEVLVGDILAGVVGDCIPVLDEARHSGILEEEHCAHWEAAWAYLAGAGGHHGHLDQVAQNLHASVDQVVLEMVQVQGREAILVWDDHLGCPEGRTGRRRGLA